MAGREALRTAVPQLALDAPLPGGGTLRDIAGTVLAISQRGLASRARLNAAGDNETGYLQPLEDIVARGKTRAERLLDLYHGAWDGDLSQIYADSRF
jgi:glutamate--cysteine ligase